MATINYCAFIDVLGYGELVKDSSTDIAQKVRILNSIYSNIATQVAFSVNEINSKIRDKIFIRSFSDCFYMECARPEPILIACNRIFNWTFGFYSSFSVQEERTLLLRGGVVKDWTVLFKDIGGIVNNTLDLNPVGLGVARAYWTSEKTNLSGMRIIISPEVINDLTSIKTINDVDFNCLGTDIVENDIPFPYFFKKLHKNEKGKSINLYELIWTYQSMSNCSFDYIDELDKIKVTFTEDNMRHFVATGQVILDGLRLSDCLSRTDEVFIRERKRLEKLIGYI